MAQILTKYAAKKMLGKQMDKHKNKDVVGQYVTLSNDLSMF